MGAKLSPRQCPETPGCNLVFQQRKDGGAERGPCLSLGRKRLMGSSRSSLV